MKRKYLIILAVLGMEWTVAGQVRRVPEQNLYERVIAVVPMTGAGTYRDPKRPLFAPLARDAKTSGVVGYTFLLSDDKQKAVVEFVARDIKALDPILKAGRADVVAFHKGHVSKAVIETEMKKHRKDFDLDKFNERKLAVEVKP